MSPHSGMHMAASDKSGMPAIPWLTYPLMLHSSREDECTLIPEQCAYRSGYWRYWYEDDHVYGLGAVYFCMAMIILFTMVNFSSFILPKQFLQESTFCRRTVASFRYLAYRGFRIEVFRWTSPSLGVMILGATGVVFFAGMTLGPKPYYWPSLDYGHSPPLATRTGWLALGLFPFVIALPTKLNLISQVTNISHEKLQVFHRWSAWAMLILALLHTFSFIVLNMSIGEVEYEWRTSVFWWTGVAALVPQAYLTIFSVGPVRHRFYEFFKYTHLLAAVVFVVFFFIHCGFTLSSADYFIAAAAIYFVPLIFSLLRTSLEYGLIRKARIQALPDGNVQVTIPVENAEWAPGQHMFIRFLAFGVHSFTKHPFSITSLPDSKELTFYLNAREGITRLLRERAESNSDGHMRVLLDGPYGGMQKARLSRGFDKVLILAGGSGASFTLPLIEDILQSQAMGENEELEDSSTEKPVGQVNVRVVLATRSRETLNWYCEETSKLLSKYCNRSSVVNEPVVDIHITAQDYIKEQLHSINTAKSEGNSDLQKRNGPTTTYTSVSQKTGRPDLPRIIREFTSENGVKVGMAVCGPSSLLSDVRNAAAEAQLRISAKHKETASEVYLHTEHFSW